jgi:hypothetical protein
MHRAPLVSLPFWPRLLPINADGPICRDRGSPEVLLHRAGFTPLASEPSPYRRIAMPRHVCRGCRHSSLMNDDEVQRRVAAVGHDVPSGESPRRGVLSEVFQPMLREHCQHRNLRQLAHVHIGEYPRIQPGPRSRSSVTDMICVELSFTDDPHRLEARPERRRPLEELPRRGQLFLAGRPAPVSSCRRRHAGVEHRVHRRSPGPSSTGRHVTTDRGRGRLCRLARRAATGFRRPFCSVARGCGRFG